jgi:uncharacterized protein YmfQ (DUF2313 family)
VTTCPPPPGAPTPFSDPLSAPTGDELLPSIIAQTPRGAAWRTDEVQDAGHNSFQHRFWRAIADPVADLYAKFSKVALASTACTMSGPEDPTNDSLEDWEAELGLPDPCMAGATLSVDQRKLLVRQKLTELGGASIPYFICIAARIGYTITINEFRPLRCGEGRLGRDRIGGAFNECVWEVRVPTPTVTFFRLGAGRCGQDRLGAFGRFADLECLLNTWKPAHTRIRFHYVYPGAAPPPF